MQTENLFLKLLSKAIVGSFEVVEIIKSEVITHCSFRDERKKNLNNLKKHKKKNKILKKNVIKKNHIKKKKKKKIK